MSLESSHLLLLLLGALGVSVGDPSPAEIADVAQTYVLRRGIPLTDVVILDVSFLLTNGSVNLGTSLLSSPIDATKDHRNVAPVLVDALATHLLIVLLLRPTRDIPVRYLEAGSLNTVDFAQHVRHKCLLQVIVTKKDASAIFSSGVSLVWGPRSAPVLYCAATYDELMTFWPKKASTSCGTATLKCRTTNALPEKIVSAVGTVYKLTLTISCNGTQARLPYEAESHLRADRVITQQNQMRLKYSPCPIAAECYSLILRESTDVTTLLKPFTLEVWLLTVLCLVLTAAIISWTESEPILSTICTIALSFIGSSAVEANCRKYSVLIIACATVSMSFLLSVVYSNSVMSYFLQIASERSPKSSVYCTFPQVCEAALESSRFMSGVRYCGLSERAKRACRLPLRREVLYPDNAGAGTFLSPCFLERNANSFSPRKLQLQVVLSRTSKSLEKLLQGGILTPEAFERHTRTQPSKFHNAYERAAAKALSRYLVDGKADLSTFVSYNMTADWFDLAKLHQLMPLMNICGFVIVCHLVAEVLVPLGGHLIGKVERYLGEGFALFSCFLGWLFEFLSRIKWLGSTKSETLQSERSRSTEEALRSSWRFK